MRIIQLTNDGTVVAEGLEHDDGAVSLRWPAKTNNQVCYHGGGTKTVLTSHSEQGELTYPDTFVDGGSPSSFQ